MKTNNPFARVPTETLIALYGQLQALRETAEPLVETNALPAQQWIMPLEMMVFNQDALGYELSARGIQVQG